MNYGRGTYLDLEPGPFSCGYRRARALCSDGKVRAVQFSSGIPDTFFSVPGSVKVRGKRVSGYVTIETAAGWTVESEGDPTVCKFVRNEYGRNAEALPRGAYREEETS